MSKEDRGKKPGSRKSTAVRKRRSKNQLGPETIDRVFDLLDINKDGQVSVCELERASRCLGWNPTREEAKQMVSDCHPKNEGFLTKNEFKQLFETHKADLEQQMGELLAAFRILDKDNPGFVSARELRVVMEKYGGDMGESEIAELISLVDKDGDGQLDIEEFAFVLCELECGGADLDGDEEGEDEEQDTDDYAY